MERTKLKVCNLHIPSSGFIEMPQTFPCVGDRAVSKVMLSPVDAGWVVEVGESLLVSPTRQ